VIEMILIKTINKNNLLIAIYKEVNGLYSAYVTQSRAEGGNIKILSSWCPHWLEETIINMDVIEWNA
jgi:hypothetical protein